MKILIDGDACSKIKQVVSIAKEKDIEVIIYCDAAHMITSDYAEVRIVESGSDSVDFAIVNHTASNDIVVTNDSGLAAMVLSKGAAAINNHGKRFTQDNILQDLNVRYLRRRTSRKRGRDQVKGRLYDHDHLPPFEQTFKQMILESEGKPEKKTGSK